MWWISYDLPTTIQIFWGEAASLLNIWEQDIKTVYNGKKHINSNISEKKAFELNFAICISEFQ